MKTIRNLAASLLVISGVLHVLPILGEGDDPNALPMLGFAVAYLVIGFLLFMDKKYSKILGIIFPMLGLGAGFVVVGIKNWDAMFTYLFIIDAIVICCCLILLLNRNNSSPNL